MTNHTNKNAVEQYLAFKEQYPGHLLFYRMGDFYEMFFDDAVQAAQILGIALTRRGQYEGKDIPMCGVPVHSHEAYLEVLMAAGMKIAICEHLKASLEPTIDSSRVPPPAPQQLSLF